LDKAVANNKIEHMGRWLIIEPAAAFGTYGTAGGQTSIDTTSSTIFVGNLSFQTTEDTL